ncbi:hypothetical protein V1477_004977 [Vespula maculifrons]|uniref:Uncharacterized protein n=1 Tax=Vespula maculifrons TaxID=7453 RepID=A0ABD2CNC3_VESMC
MCYTVSLTQQLQLRSYNIRFLDHQGVFFCSVGVRKRKKQPLGVSATPLQPPPPNPKRSRSQFHDRTCTFSMDG